MSRGIRRLVFVDGFARRACQRSMCWHNWRVNRSAGAAMQTSSAMKMSDEDAVKQSVKAESGRATNGSGTGTSQRDLPVPFNCFGQCIVQRRLRSPANRIVESDRLRHIDGVRESLGHELRSTTGR